jgi:hypothetical protein
MHTKKSHKLISSDLSETQVLHTDNTLGPTDFHISFLENDDKFIQQSLKQLQYTNCNYIKNMEETFFSKENIEIIQNDIRERIYKISNYIIPKQNEHHIREIMLGIYNDQSNFLPYKFKEQLERLNKIIVEFCEPFILSQINANKKYIEFIEKPREFPPLPESISVAGKRSLPSMFIY